MTAVCQCDGSLPNYRFLGDCKYFMNFRKYEDGLSNTILVGEKHVPLGTLGTNAGADCSIYNPDSNAMFCRMAGEQFPLGSPNEDVRYNFGSWHPGICQFLFGDGSVQSLRVEIDPITLGYLANRKDGNVVPGDIF
jgi:hypothetical protein